MRQFYLQCVQRLRGPFALSQVKHERDPLRYVVFEGCQANQYRYATAILTVELLFEWLQSTGNSHFRHQDLLAAVPPFGRRQVGPVHTSGEDIFTIVAYDAQEGVVGLENLSLKIPDHDSNDVCINQPADPGFALCKVPVQTSILERDRGLGGQQLEDSHSCRSKGMWRQVGLQIKHAQHSGLLEDREAENGSRVVLANVVVGGERALNGGIV